MFQAYIYPPPEEIWTKIKRICHKFVSGGEATEEKTFILWNYELICTPREEVGLGMICPKKRFDSIAVQNVGRMMLQANLIKKWLTERAAAMPLGLDTIYAHQSLLKHWMEGSKRWKGMVQSFWKSPFCVTPEPENRWEVEREQLAFNRRIPFRGATPFGNQKGSARLLGLTMGDVIWHRADGSRGLKDKEALASELGSAEAAKLALNAFGAAPASGEPVAATSDKELGLIGEARTNLVQSKLCKNGEVLPLKEIRLGLVSSARTVKEQRRWVGDGRVIEWKGVIKQRDSLATPARAREILLRLHCRNLQVRERLFFMKEKVVCPHCKAEERPEHCLLGCLAIQKVVRFLQRGLAEMC
ncbi:unnamed protein product [Closterium sp. NIES-65]|nr:unnamed protein product [Closterium sp. NIES-65]